MQTLVIRLPERVARQVRSFMETKGHGYASLNEFMEVALVNQLTLESGWQEAPANALTGEGKPQEHDPAHVSRSDSSEFREIAQSPFLARPEWQHPSFAEPMGVSERLFALTNRLSPVKVATRVLANLAKDGDWPTLTTFHDQSAAAARLLGIRLREEDRVDGGAGALRRWVGYPIGSDERAALDRFVFSFTMSASGGSATGPLAVLGLASVEGGYALLTEAGWALAEAPSPLLGEATGGTVSEVEAKILRQQVRQAPVEAIAVREFLSDVKRSAGHQGRLDELMALRFPGWTQNLTIAQRSAMLGRLGDLKAVSVSGRGSTAKIQLLPAAHELEAD